MFLISCVCKLNLLVDLSLCIGTPIIAVLLSEFYQNQVF